MNNLISSAYFTSGINVLILFLNFVQSLSSCIHTVKRFNTNVIWCVCDVKLIFFDVLLRKPHQRRDQNTRYHVQFVWKARLVDFAFYNVVLSNGVIKLSFWFHFVGKKLVYRRCNFHDIIPSTLAVITNVMHPKSNYFVKFWNQSTISWRHNKTTQNLFHEKFAIIFLFRLNLKSTVYFIQKYDF